MKEINCNIIRDLLPLYEDDVASADTAELVREHLKDCAACRQELKQMRLPVTVPPDGDAAMLKQFQRRWRMARLKTAVIVLCVAAVLAAIVGSAVWYTRPRPMIEALELQEADISALTVKFDEPIFPDAPEVLQSQHNDWTLETQPEEEAFLAVMDLLEQGTIRSRLGNLLGGRSSVNVSGGGESIRLTFTMNGERFEIVNLLSGGTLWRIPSGDSGIRTYTQTNDRLFGDLVSVIKQYGTVETQP